jgi:selenocysteine-specific translation elongation factor
MPKIEIGKVSDFFKKPVVIGINLTASLKVGDKVHIKGHTTDLELIVQSMQIDNITVKEAKTGDAVGIKINGPARQGDTVYKVT